MSFTEKSAWVMALSLLACGAFYGLAVMSQSAALGRPAPPNIGLAALVTLPLVSLAILGHAFAALGDPGDARTPEDERDRFISWRAGNLAGKVFGAITIFGLSAYAIQGDGNLLFHLAVLGLVISQLAEYALSILFYRRGMA